MRVHTEKYHKYLAMDNLFSKLLARQIILVILLAQRQQLTVQCKRAGRCSSRRGRANRTTRWSGRLRTPMPAGFCPGGLQCARRLLRRFAASTLRCLSSLLWPRGESGLSRNSPWRAHLRHRQSASLPSLGGLWWQLHVKV